MVQQNLSSIIYKEYRPIVFSGGAIGVDSIAEECSDELGVLINIISFEKHITGCKSEHRINISEILLKDARKRVIAVKRKLGRPFPTKNPYSDALIERDYYQIRDSLQVFAFTRFDGSGKIADGTAWAVEMAKEREIAIFLYDLDRHCWYRFSYYKHIGWVPLAPSIIYGNLTIIGTTELNEVESREVKNQIQKILTALIINVKWK